jgi:hypothetical protein
MDDVQRTPVTPQPAEPSEKKKESEVKETKKKIILTAEEKERLLSLKDRGNMSQPEAREYHELLKKEEEATK